MIGRFGLGVDNIDIKAAAAHNIVVTYVPDCLREVSDHAMALVLALARKVPFSNSLVQQGRWEIIALGIITSFLYSLIVFENPITWWRLLGLGLLILGIYFIQ